MINERRKKIIAIFFMLILLAFLFSSIAFIAHEASHDCDGENCPICELISSCSKFIKEVGSALLTIIILSNYIFIKAFIKNRKNSENFKKESLVSLNVMMLN
ncbi:MAG: hypothetical protein K5923_01605 [Clostridia bacterium]|nr:hypothetical protein [Clostridia bacterium]